MLLSSFSFFSQSFSLQGFVEDQFGLGLIAIAVEEGIAVIKPMGIMIFNMEVDQDKVFANVCLSNVVSVLLSFGKPKLFRPVDLSFSENYISTKNAFLMNCLIQAADTNIFALVEIEKNSPHRLEFFMGLLGINSFALEWNGPTGRPVAAFLMLYQFTAVNFVNQIRFAIHFHIYLWTYFSPDATEKYGENDGASHPKDSERGFPPTNF